MNLLIDYFKINCLREHKYSLNFETNYDQSTKSDSG